MASDGESAKSLAPVPRADLGQSRAATSVRQQADACAGGCREPPRQVGSVFGRLRSPIRGATDRPDHSALIQLYHRRLFCDQSLGLRIVGLRLLGCLSWGFARFLGSPARCTADRDGGRGGAGASVDAAAAGFLSGVSFECTTALTGGKLEIEIAMSSPFIYGSRNHKTRLDPRYVGKNAWELSPIFRGKTELFARRWSGQPMFRDRRWVRLASLRSHFFRLNAGLRPVLRTDL